MSREPGWETLGAHCAEGKNKSSMKLPDDYFEQYKGDLTKPGFNVFQHCHEYAVSWLETEQWEQEVGRKIKIYLKKIKSPNERIEQFEMKAYEWVDGYTDFMVKTFYFMWKDMAPHLKDERFEQKIEHLEKAVLAEMGFHFTDNGGESDGV